MAKFTLSVPDMSCQHCVNRITKALAGLGLSKHSVSLEDKVVEVEAPDIKVVMDALEEIGYPASIVQDSL
ncbi:cation transporter [Acetomicrobium sp. S15 = DSM 107314]|uniref:cation transporter n=1 Tax=Acetomicrobium sp. S15 = DSM 107314 TaxID=2529858 RepID=UPI0018E1B321